MLADVQFKRRMPICNLPSKVVKRRIDFHVETYFMYA